MESQRQKVNCDGKKPSGLCWVIWTTCCSNSVLVVPWLRKGLWGYLWEAILNQDRHPSLIDTPCGCKMAYLMKFPKGFWMTVVPLDSHFPPGVLGFIFRFSCIRPPPPLPGEGRCWWHLSSEWTLWVPVRCWVHITASACCVTSQVLCVFSVLKWINVHELQSVTWTEIVRKMFSSKWFPLCTHKYIPLKNSLKIPDFPEDIADDP